MLDVDGLTWLGDWLLLLLPNDTELWPDEEDDALELPGRLGLEDMIPDDEEELI